MHTSPHAAPRRGRYLALFAALLLQAGFVWVLVSGLTLQQIKDIIPGPIIGYIIPKPATPPKPVVDPRMLEPTPTKPIPLPPIQFGEPKDPPITLEPVRPPPAGVADSGPFGIATTHTTPAYPPIEARLGHQGTVVLRLTISAQGTVVEAAVVRSCGFERLDEAARAWVLAHWRYRPAVRGGVAVPSGGNVSVTFDLRNAG